jgi:hypothetical protein
MTMPGLPVFGKACSFIAAMILSAMLLAHPALAGCPCNDNGASGPDVPADSGQHAALLSFAAAGQGNTDAAGITDDDSNISNRSGGTPTPTPYAIGARTNARTAVSAVASRIVGSRVVRGIRNNVVPAVASRMNKTVYELNRTDMVRIAKGVRTVIRRVASAVEHIEINRTPLVVNEVENPAVQISAILRRPNGDTVEKNLTVVRIRNGEALNLSSEGVAAETDADIVYENGAVYISKSNRTVELKTLPDSVKARIRERLSDRSEIREMRLEMAQDRLRYRVRTHTRKRLLGLFDVDVEEDSEVDADTGEVRSTSGPWWGFLAF